MKVLITGHTDQEKGPLLYADKIGEQFKVAQPLGDDSFVTLPEAWRIRKQDCHTIEPAWKVMKDAEETGREVEVWDDERKKFCFKTHPGWWIGDIYRLKPEAQKPKFTQYTWENEEDRKALRGLWVKHIEEEYEAMIVQITPELIHIWDSSFNWTQFHKYHTHLDGSPIGKEEIL